MMAPRVQLGRFRFVSEVQLWVAGEEEEGGFEAWQNVRAEAQATAQLGIAKTTPVERRDGNLARTHRQ